MLLPSRAHLRSSVALCLILMIVGSPISLGAAPKTPGAVRPDGAPAAPVATPGLAYKSFVGTDFHRVASDTGFAYDGGGGVHLTSLSATDSALVVNVDLPQGAVIRE